jgi:S-adenosyl-L-methionine hydrolase (adenosine-forming)
VARSYDTVSFLSDLGTSDESVGVVKAVLRDLAPHAVVIDLTHDVPPFDVRAGSLALARAISFLPSGVVLASVDPAGGTSRRAIAIEVADGEGVLLGPDNGLLAPAVSMAGGAGRCVVLDLAEHHLPAPGLTFAVRDVFAPVAAALCNGVDLDQLGTTVDADDLVPGMVPLPREEAGVMMCEVLWVDRFGNCQLNVGADDVAAWGDQLRVSVGDPHDPTRRVARRVSHFAAIGTGAVGLVVDGHGMLALALDRRSAAEELGIATGDLVVLAPSEDGEPPAMTTSPVTLGPSR